MTKIDKIELILKSGNKVTPLIALQVCGTMRLADIIYQLKKRGLSITTTIKEDTQGCDYAEYTLAKKPALMASVVPEPPKQLEYKPELSIGSAAVVLAGQNLWAHHFPVGTLVTIISPVESDDDGSIGFFCAAEKRGVQCIPKDELMAYPG